MSPTRTAAFVILAMLLGACSHAPAPDAADQAKPQAASASTAIPASNPFAPMLKDRDRAKAVQQSINAHDAAERKALKEAQQ
ncbi:hypothetical protein [Oleiagrimonas sp.]|jgi:PBP1b-binding outer membrane lipoprotein LpoB|uniref:hypothetical protein n=1 Tax=Oleiagrimonas sp. TaxID=2010330 RepID=UPI0026201B1C|nr:hypothetical protein [Oleiagrimonas sp.]MDA3914014.1 hypothetical protein [Oleiagrimonas sp.]